MTLQPWTYGDRHQLADVRIFRLTEQDTTSPRTGQRRRCARIEAGPWVNVVALTADHELLLVRQWRHGVRDFTLEIPGGLVDAQESPAEAAARELREETGYVGESPALLGVVQPNPAIQDNLCHTFLVRQCRRDGALQQDDGEDLEVVRRPVRAIPELVASGDIRHSLVVCAFWWLRALEPDLFP